VEGFNAQRNGPQALQQPNRKRPEIARRPKLERRMRCVLMRKSNAIEQSGVRSNQDAEGDPFLMWNAIITGEFMSSIGEFMPCQACPISDEPGHFRCFPKAQYFEAPIKAVCAID
jgi:hypothetical protein